MYLKNDSSPNAIYAILVNASDGSPITTGVTVYHIQGTTRTAGAGTLAHIANGRWCYVPTQAETNYDAFAIDFYHADAIGQGAIVEVVTANQGLSVITADTSAIKQRTDTYLDTTISSRAPANTALSNTVWTDAKAAFLDAAISSRLAASSYVAPDNASIAAIKSQTDKLQFDASNYVYATGLGGGGSVQVVVQPLPVRIQNIAYDGGVLTGWLYSKLVASLLVQNADLTGHNLRLLLFARNDPLTSVAEYSTASSEITITYNAPDSLVQINGPDTKTPPAGNYGYVLRDQSTDTVLVSGTCLIHAAPDAS